MTVDGDNPDMADRPFRGARPYRYEDRDLFFGREVEARELLRRAAGRAVLLYGPRGSGKTSLLEAGVVPAAEAAGLRAERVKLRPHPGRELRLSPDESVDAGALRARLDGDRTLIVFDEFDDLVTLFDATATLRESQAQVVALVRELIAAPEASVVLSFREEHLGRVLELLGPAAGEHMRLTPPDADAVETIVRGPFRAHPGRFGRELSPAVAAKLAETVRQRSSGEPLDLAELQLACLRLWEAEHPETLLERHGLRGLAGEIPPAQGPPPDRSEAFAEERPLTFAERRLRVLLLLHAAWSAILAIGYIAGGDTGAFGFMPNSFSKDVLFVGLSLLAAWHVRRHGWLSLVVAAGYLGLVVGQVAALAWGGSPDYELFGIAIPATAALLGWMAIDVLLIVLFVWWWIAAVRSRWGLRFLHPLAFLSLIAVAEVVIEGEREVMPPRDVARNVDRYLARLDASGKARVSLALAVLGIWPLLTLRPPLPMLAPDARRRYLERRFVTDVGQRRTFGPLRPVVQAMIRVGSQMAYLGYYGDRRSWKDIGYTPFRERPGGRAPTRADLPDPPLRSLTAPPVGKEYDAIVVGSGAAGGILAHHFARAGMRVLVLERGPHVDPRGFSDDEVDQYLRLYNEGALQLATDFKLQVLQGMCVGGGTTVNNALCLDPPGEVLDAWERDHGLERSALEGAIRDVRRFLPVGPIHEAATTSIAARRFAEAAFRIGLPGRVELMEVNISERCLGCGYCNIGCAYGAKLSMLDTALPWAQRDYDRLDVLPDFEVTRIVHEGDRAVAVEGRHADGGRFTFSADVIAIAAGALHSSLLLQRSGIGGARPGRGLHFNINSPLTAEFPEPVDAFAGLQMSHAYVPDDGIPGYLVETWFNPPATQSLSMPGWFGRHFENMRRYRYMAAGGALVGTTSPGRVTATRGGFKLDYTPSETDLHRLLEGLKVMGRIFLAAGARRVMPATYLWHEFRDEASLDDLDAYVRDNADLLLTTAHPQGGNAIGDVVDTEFRVRGFRNLYLCDASVFPTSVHVNPQLTVMGMAELAASRIVSSP